MSSLFSRPMIRLQYSKCASPIRLLFKPRSHSLVALGSTPQPQSCPPTKSDRRGLKIAGALTLTSILAVAYYKSGTSQPNPISLNPITFTPYTLTAKIPIASGPTETAIFTLTPPSASPTPPQKLPFATGVLSIQIKQPQLQIARSYTPLPAHENGDIRLLIKKEPGSEMTRYLYSLKEGDSVEIRGPEVEYVYPPKDDKKIVFFAGGTGIAPALQVAGSLLLNEDGREMEVEILWAVRHKGETCGAMEEEVSKLVKIIDAAGQGRELVVRTYVDSEGGIQAKDIERAISAKGGRRSSYRVFVSGPEGFIAWIAGPKGFRGGREEQGPLRGMLRTVLRKNGSDVEVFKL